MALGLRARRAMDPRSKADSIGIGGESDGTSLETENRQLRAEVTALRQTIAAREASTTAISAREIALEAALLALPVGIAVFDADDRLVIKNNRFQLFDSEGKRDRPGTPFEDILKFAAELGLAAEARDDPEAWIRDRLRQRQEPGPARVQGLSDGRFIQIEERPLEDGGLISAYTDVTQLKKTEAALSRALEQSEAAGRSKTQFLAKMSHELRTPLNAIIGFCQMMIEDKASRITEERRQGYLSDIQFAAGHLHDLISDILELARIESGQEKLERRLVDVADLGARVTKMFEPDAKANAINLTFKRVDETDISPVCSIDDRLVTQMLINLLTNSMRYAPEAGFVTLELDLREDETVLAVLDNGPGISPEDLAVIMEPFQQGGIKSARGQGGVGLGLSLTKGMAELHGGTIMMESTLGEGTRVTLRLPVHLTDEPVSSEP